MTQNKFKELIGGRIIYSTMFRDCKTLKHDLIVYKTMTKYRALKKGNWYAAEKTKEELYKQNVKLRFTPYLHTIIARFYKIRKAIKDTQQELTLIQT